MKISAMPELARSSESNPAINQNTISESPPPVAPPAVTEPAKVEDERISAQVADMARKEKLFRSKIQARELALKQREEALKARETELNDVNRYVPKTKITEAFRKDPYQAMRDFDISGDQLTQGLLNQPSPQDRMIQQLQAQIEELKGSYSKTQTQLQERDTQARQNVVSQIKADVRSLVQSDPQFDTIKSTNSEDAVVEYIEKKFDEEGILISIEQAAEAVENELIEELTKYVQLKKIQERMNPAPIPPVSGSNPAKSLPSATPSVKTLSHSQVNTASRPMTPRERAIAILEGTLNS